MMERKWVSKEEAMEILPSKSEGPTGKGEVFMIPDKPESINHPPHYQGKKFEVIDVIEDFELSFNLGNAIKYILRAGKKGCPIEDMKKAIWYLEREASFSKEKN